jgi:hypothetical protein
MELAAPDTGYNVYLGNSAATSGDYGVADAYSEDGEGNARGAISVF